MFGPVQISPSILSADFLRIGDAVRCIEEAETDWVHVDVMDGHFVPNLTLGPPTVKALKGATRVPLDVHLMIDNPTVQLPWYLDAGADLITFHIETADEPQSLIDEIHGAGRLCGITLCPPTPLSMIEPYIPFVDLVLVMSVNPGFSGQTFIEDSISRVERVAKWAQRDGVNPLIEVDGGINPKTASAVVACGADMLVAGNAIFGMTDPGLALKALRKAGEMARAKRLS